ncbi:MAG TPA: hypothetical protein VF799_05350, partial [Geobacteraceae bacterium]
IRFRMAALAAACYGGTAGGTANALTVTLNPPLSAHTPGVPITFLSAAANTGAATIDINGLGAVAIKRLDGTDLRVGDIMAGQRCEVVWDGSVYQLTNANNPSISSRIINITRDSSLNSSTVAVTGVGFRPSAMIMLCSTAGANGSYSVGYSDGTTNTLLYANEVPNSQISTSYCGVVGTSSGNTVITLGSFNQDGATLNVVKTSNPTGIITISAMFLK